MRNSAVVGDPKVFAVEYAVTDMTHEKTLLHGPCRLILANLPFGDADDEVYFIAVWRELHGLALTSRRFDPLPAVPRSALELQALVNSELSNRNDFFWIAGFDDFIKLCFRQGDDLIIYWCLRPDVSNRAVYAGYPKGVQVAVVPFATLKQVAALFRRRCDLLLAVYPDAASGGDAMFEEKPRHKAAKSVLPKNHVELFNASEPYVKGDGQVSRYAMDRDGEFHRFEPSAQGRYHWSGATNGRTINGVRRGLDVPSEMRQVLSAKRGR